MSLCSVVKTLIVSGAQPRDKVELFWTAKHNMEITWEMQEKYLPENKNFDNGDFAGDDHTSY